MSGEALAAFFGAASGAACEAPFEERMDTSGRELKTFPNGRASVALLIEDKGMALRSSPSGTAPMTVPSGRTPVTVSSGRTPVTVPRRPVTELSGSAPLL